MIRDIFLRSYAADLPWVPYALRSIHKFITGIRDVIIAIPPEDIDAFQSLNLTIEKLVPSQVPQGNMDGYMVQQLDKLIADHYTDAEYLMFWDSDVIAVREFSPKNLIIGLSPRCLITPYSMLVDANGSQATPWKAIVEKALGRAVEFEMMRAHPFLTHRSALRGVRNFMESFHDCTLLDYVSAQPGREFSEFNVLHGWAYYNEPELFYWWNTETEGVPGSFVKQHWSYGGITPEIRAEMERILA